MWGVCYRASVWPGGTPALGRVASADVDGQERHGVVAEDVDDFDGDGVAARLGIGVNGGL